MRQGSAAWLRALEQTKAASDAGLTLPALLPKLATAHRDRPALLGAADVLSFSYRSLAARVASVSAWARSQQIAAGQTVCLLMPNMPDYVALWLGLGGAGCVVALLNTGVLGEGLLHCVAAAQSRAIIVAQSLLPALAAVADRLPTGTRVWVHGGDGAGWPTFEPKGDDAEPGPSPKPESRALLIYTSGTTGLPKAAVITHARIMEWSTWFAGMTGAGPQDCMYDCLPLYHSVGGIVAVGAMLVTGGAVLIRDRFSASRFWDDVADGGCTMFQYIGELCRYLLNAPPHSRERAHRLRLACGNGLTGDIWAAVQERFAIPQILEFYAATEGCVSLYNVEGKAGAIGRIPPFLQHRMGVALICVDLESGEPLRDAKGHCVPCTPEQPGEAIGQLGAAGRRFEGYVDATASERKVLADVFVAGDRWFRTGDLLRRDREGFYYFVDRIGDNFRWKGENVSATEVTAVLRGAPDVTDAAVYGVHVPGHEGRAGMAALTTTDAFDPAKLYGHLQQGLPRYAQPLFIRMCGALDMTATFKSAKARLAQEGFAATADPIWFNDQMGARLVPVSDSLISEISSGRRRL